MKSLGKQLSVFLFFIFSFIYSANAQHITSLQSGSEYDSSYYHLAKIGANEFWACGEYGIVTMFDTLGHYQKIPIQTEGYNILKAERCGDVVILSTDDSRLMKYDLTKQNLQKADFPKFKNRCFYDFLILPEGKILLCGGTTGISKGEKKIPYGFIAITDTSLSKPKILWKSYRKFVWSMARKKDGSITAAVFNGMNTRLITSSDLSSWKKSKKIKGLVHELMLKDTSEEITYAGAASMHYKRDGIFCLDGAKKCKTINSGCLWSQKISKTNQVYCGQKGQLMIFDMDGVQKTIQLPTGFALYDFHFFSDNKLLVVGHGKCAFVVDF